MAKKVGTADPVTRYARDVRDGKIVVSALVRLAWCCDT
jgi:hypothetical protein